MNKVVIVFIILKNGNGKSEFSLSHKYKVKNTTTQTLAILNAFSWFFELMHYELFLQMHYAGHPSGSLGTCCIS